MTRGHTPPDSLTAEDIMALAQVRKDIWVNGMKGFGFGGAASYLLHCGAVFARDKKFISSTINLNRNTAFASVMIGASLGSFLFATTEGKNVVHELHPIFRRGARPIAVPDDAVDMKNQSYHRSLQRAKERNDDLKELEMRRLARRLSREQGTEKREGLQTNKNSADIDMQELRSNRVIRRMSLNSSLQNGQGISDSHGGHWVQNSTDLQELRRNRVLRRTSLSSSLQNGHGISDSHGGNWVQDDFRKE